MKVIALTKYSNHGASSRVRFLNLVPHMKARGVDVKVVPLLSNIVLKELYRDGTHRRLPLVITTLKRVGYLLLRDSSAMLWIEKELVFGMPRIVEELLVRNWRRIIIDYDDAVYLKYSDGWLGRFGRLSKFSRYAQAAGCVVVGSEGLREALVAFGGRRVRHVPSTVDVEAYEPRDHVCRETVVVGWIGTPKTVHFLDVVAGALRRVAMQASIEVRVVGAEWHCPGVSVSCYDWSEEREAKLVSGFDIGIMPLLEGPWERAKCGYKIIQYMAGGVVPVASRVGENSRIIRDGENGFLAGDEDEWVARLLSLCSDVALRSLLGQRARQDALSKYDVRVAAETMCGVICEASRRSLAHLT